MLRQVLLLLVCLVCRSATAGTTVSMPFRGITDYHVSQDSGGSALDYHVLRIDMADPDIRFQTTPANGPDVSGDTTRQTTRAFVAQIGAQVGINANFFDNSNPFSTTTTLVSLAVSAGSVITPWQAGFDQGLNISPGNVATLIERNSADPTGLSSLPSTTLYNAISGTSRLVRSGVEQAYADTDPEPRTAAGVDAQGNLILLVVDGRDPGHSDGMTLHTLADTMFAYGAVDAFNLDGGGSSTLVYADPTARVVNVPVGLGNIPGTERATGNNLAIFAAAVPEPTLLPAMLIFAVATLRRRRELPIEAKSPEAALS